MAGSIIHLIGYPGVGKLSVARELVARRPDCVLVDNHLINTPILRVVGADGRTPLPKEVWAQVAKIRAVVLDTMTRLAPSRLDFVMTNFATDRDEDVEQCRKLEAIAEGRGGRYVPVMLSCEAGENRRRVALDDRRANGKLTDPDALDALRDAVHLIDFDGHPNVVRFDTTDQPAAAVAEAILESLQDMRDG